MTSRLNNCVGHGNHRAFLAFLVYATGATCHALGLLAAHAIYALRAATSNQALRTGPQAKAGFWMAQKTRSRSCCGAFLCKECR